MEIINQSAFDVFPVTPSNTTVFKEPARGFIVSDASQADVEIQTLGGQNVTLANLKTGVIHWFSCKQIRTGTTASNIFIVK